MIDSSRFITGGVWFVFLSRQSGKRILDGEATDSAKARHLFHLAIRDEPVTTLVERVNPVGEVVDHSRGAYEGPHSSLTH